MDFRTEKEAFDAELTLSDDIICLDFDIAGRSASLYYVDGLIDKTLFEQNALRPLKNMKELEEPYENSFNKSLPLSAPIEVTEDREEAMRRAVTGDVVMMVDGGAKFYILALRDYNVRAIIEPPTETVLRGPREGFVEDLKTNMTLIRRKLRTPKLRFSNAEAGKYSGTTISVCYIEGVAMEGVVEEVKKRIGEIETDGIIDSSYVSRYLENGKNSLFNQVGVSEKPDIIAAKLLEGRVAVIVDGSPMVLTVPLVMLEEFQSAEDYYVKNYRSTLSRLVRLFAFLTAVLLPAGYVALQEFQYQVFPLKVLSTIINTISGVPLPPTIEMLFVILIFLILNEASVRMPKHIGMTISVVGAIILGESAVSAGLLSTPTILVVALSSIAMYCVPNEVDTVSVLRIIFVLIAGVTGLYGVLLAGIALIAYLVSLRGYGTSYLAPFAPSLPHDLQDAFIKSDYAQIDERPYSIPTVNRKRKKKL